MSSRFNNNLSSDSFVSLEIAHSLLTSKGSLRGSKNWKFLVTLSSTHFNFFNTSEWTSWNKFAERPWRVFGIGEQRDLPRIQPTQLPEVSSFESTDPFTTPATNHGLGAWRTDLSKTFVPCSERKDTRNLRLSRRQIVVRFDGVQSVQSVNQASNSHCRESKWQRSDTPRWLKWVLTPNLTIADTESNWYRRFWVMKHVAYKSNNRVNVGTHCKFTLAGANDGCIEVGSQVQYGRRRQRSVSGKNQAVIGCMLNATWGNESKKRGIWRGLYGLQGNVWDTGSVKKKNKILPNSFACRSERKCRQKCLA